MKFNLESIPMVNAAAGVLAGMGYTFKCIVVDHITIHQVDPNEWDRVFLLSIETTFKIRNVMEQIGDKLVVINTSNEQGLERWDNFFFPHWLFCVSACNQITPSNSTKPFLFDALLGRQKDTRTALINELAASDMLQRGIISYSTGFHYKSNTTATTQYFDVWDYEEDAIKDLYVTKENYINRDSTTRLKNGYFSSCLIPKRIYDATSVSLVAETDNIGSHVFVTEKTWKPIMQGRPVVFYATPEHEIFLESLGFKFPYKCYGQTEKVVEGLLTANTDYVEHNKTLADPNYWTAKLYDWLEQFRS